MRNEGLARLKLSRKQLVIVVTYRSSVTLTSWDMSHHPVPLSDLVVLPNNPSPSSLSFMAVFWVFLFPSPSLSALCSRPVSSIFASSHPDNTHFFYFCPPAHIGRRCLARLQLWQGTAVRWQTPLICLSCVQAHTHALSLSIQLQNHFEPATNQSSTLTSTGRWRGESDGVAVLMKVTGCKARNWNAFWLLREQDKGKENICLLFCILQALRNCIGLCKRGLHLNCLRGEQL